MADKRAGTTRPPEKDSMRVPKARRRGQVALAIFFAGFSLFVLNVLLGKASIVFDWQNVPLLGDVPEFLLLLAAVTVFVVAFLQRESAEESNETANRED